MYRAPPLDAPPLATAPDARLVPAPADGLVPDGFFSTTNHPTYARINGAWHLARAPRMDAHLCWDAGQGALVTVEMRRVKAGQPVVCAQAEDGSEGVLTWDQGFLQEGAAAHRFAFMSTEISREKPVNYDRILDAFMEHRRRGFILWTIGPALVHARGRTAMQWMVDNGLCHGLLTGNAVAVHDVEAALFGTTLGMTADGSGTVSGHSTHMRAIHRVRRAGSISELVRTGELDRGIMHALERRRVPYVLAGSIRDDGPLPETLVSAIEAQDAMRALAQRATMVVMVATALHAIALGNMLPTFHVDGAGHIREITTLCVDQTEFVVNKLRDRGTHQAFGVVTNAQDFMRILQAELAPRVAADGPPSA